MDFPSSPQQSTLTQMNKFSLDNESNCQGTRYKTDLDLEQYAVDSLRESSSNTCIIQRRVMTEVPRPSLANMSELTTNLPPDNQSDDSVFETPTSKK